ncbi:hypothetical protein K8I28_06775 [bacterium]|nr:hypothetical protein [bacterium]
MNKKSKELHRDQRLREIGYVLALGVIRMKEAEELLTSGWKEGKKTSQKPSKAC